MRIYKYYNARKVGLFLREYQCLIMCVAILTLLVASLLSLI